MGAMDLSIIKHIFSIAGGNQFIIIIIWRYVTGQSTGVFYLDLKVSKSILNVVVCTFVLKLLAIHVWHIYKKGINYIKSRITLQTFIWDRFYQHLFVYNVYTFFLNKKATDWISRGVHMDENLRRNWLYKAYRLIWLLIV